MSAVHGAGNNVCAVDVLGDTAILPLRRRDGSIADYAFVDPEDAELIGAHRWFLRPGGYAARNQTVVSRTETPDGKGRQQTVLLHREVLGLKVGDGIEVDHRNVEKLDCRKANLRICSHAQNGQNFPARGRGSSKYRGVSFCKAKGRWQTSARVDGRQHHVGFFDTELGAHEAVVAFRREHMPYSTN